jgi:hypothetical protein
MWEYEILRYAQDDRVSFREVISAPVAREAAASIVPLYWLAFPVSAEGLEAERILAGVSSQR